jgi:hypothetical protein
MSMNMIIETIGLVGPIAVDYRIGAATKKRVNNLNDYADY